MKVFHEYELPTSVPTIVAEYVELLNELKSIET